MKLTANLKNDTGRDIETVITQVLDKNGDHVEWAWAVKVDGGEVFDDGAANEWNDALDAANAAARKILAVS